MVARVEFNPFTPEVHLDPYPTYRRMREEDPVHHNELLGVWFLTRYPDCVNLLKDARFLADRRAGNHFREHIRREIPSMLGLDPPDHTRLRTLVSKAFTPRTVEGLRGRIATIVGRLLDEAAERGQMDVVQDFAYPLPVTVIAEMMGVPAEDHPRFADWSEKLVVTLDPIVSEEQVEAAFDARDALFAYWKGIVAERRRQPRDDLVSALVAAEAEGDKLSELELLVMCNLILIAGHETTVNLIGNGLLTLLGHPDQLQRLRADPGLIESAVEELLRFDSPVQLTGRVAAQDLELHGHRVQKGEPVITILGAANRDPEQFPDPDRLDLGRTPNAHIAFGRGIHFCLGAPLARLEAQMAFNALLQRFPRLRLGGEPELRPTIVLRGLSSLPVNVS